MGEITCYWSRKCEGTNCLSYKGSGRIFSFKIKQSDYFKEYSSSLVVGVAFKEDTEIRSSVMR